MLEEIINKEIKLAMLAKDSTRLLGLRSIKAALLNTKSEKGFTGEVTEDIGNKILQKLAKQRKESAEIYLEQNRKDLYDLEISELDVINGFLPKQMTEDELTSYIQEVITRVGALTSKDMGKVIGTVNKELVGKADGKLISTIVKNILV